MKVFLLFPHQLYENIKNLKGFDKIILYEDPLFFGDEKRIANFNKKKIILHRASMKYYFDYLKKNKLKAKYVEYKVSYKKLFNILSKAKVTIYDPVDHLLTERLKKSIKNLTIFESPNFVCTKKDLKVYYDSKKNSGKKIFHQTSFYSWNRKRLNILSGYKLSYDKENRKIIPRNTKLPKDFSAKRNKYIDEAIKYTNKKFKNNYGNTDNFYFPITHKDSKKWFKKFLKNKLKNFGEFQDFIHTSENPNLLYHSGIAPMLNIGLLDPNYVIQKVLKYTKKVKINELEGFIRQIIGWREYVRFIYLFDYKKVIQTNYFDYKNTLNKKWYSGNLGIAPVDMCIKKAFDTGYLHHIERLMIVSNFMNLCQIRPSEIYRWFMEFSLDSYDWVMVGNIYCMAVYNKTTTKPYISSSNYILKMSHYSKKEKWTKIWDALYWSFMDKYKNQLKSIPRFGPYQINILNKLKDLPDRKKLAKKFLESIN